VKKIFIILSFVLLAQPALAQVIDPQWSEFCPDKYINAEYKIPTLWDYWFSFSREPKNYWANRKNEFEANIKTCRDVQSSEDELYSCYLQVRGMEQNKNSVIAEQQYAKAEKDRQFMQTYNQINGSIQQNLQTQQTINAYNQPKQYYHNVNVRSY